MRQILAVALLVYVGTAVADPVVIEPLPSGDGVIVTCSDDDCLGGNSLSTEAAITIGKSPTAPERLALLAAYALRKRVGMGDADYVVLTHKADPSAVSTTTVLGTRVGGLNANENVVIGTDPSGTHVTSIHGTFPRVTEAMRAPATLSEADAIAAATSELNLSEEALAYFRRTHTSDQGPYSTTLVTTPEGPMWVVEVHAARAVVHVDARSGAIKLNASRLKVGP